MVKYVNGTLATPSYAVLWDAAEQIFEGEAQIDVVETLDNMLVRAKP